MPSKTKTKEKPRGVCDVCDQGLSLPRAHHGLDCPKRKPVVKLVSAGAIEQPKKERGIPGKKMEPHHIEAVGRALRRGAKNALTIKGLAKRLRCSLGAAERRFNAYMKAHEGFDQKLKTCPVRDGERGPFSTGFYL